MNLQIKQRWVGALKSGQYAQTRGSLHDNKGFCCLGVLCDLYLKDSRKEWECEPGVSYKTWRIEGQYSMLPDSVAEWAGLPSRDPGVWVPPSSESEMQYARCLSTVNDTGSTFEQIADLIEEQL